MVEFGPGLRLDQMPAFVPGKVLCRRFYQEAVRPIVDAVLAGRPHAAALLGCGSDVLGFDTPLSRDHGWGPRCSIYLREDDADLAESIVVALGERLPLEIGGYPTNYHNWTMARSSERPVRHLVDVGTIRGFGTGYLGVDATRPIAPPTWLKLPSQRLRTLCSGATFHDGWGELDAMRARLAWYPRDVWLYLLGCAWRKIEQEEPFMARCGDLGDELGSHLVAARQAQEIMRLCFLIERQYPPYTKWFGAAFSLLPCAAEIGPLLRRAVTAAPWQERERCLTEALLSAARRHNALGITEALPTESLQYYGRPYQVVSRERFSVAIFSAIESNAERRFPDQLGAIWQWADSTDVLDRLDRCEALALGGAR